jgi:hypothetical protein
MANPILVTGAAGRVGAIGRTVAELLLKQGKLGLPTHLVSHLATMADLHRAGSYDRMSDDVLTLTGQQPQSLQEFVRKNAAAFTE